MELKYCKSKREKGDFLRFRAQLYRGDANAFCTSEFVAADLIYGNTGFARACEILPVCVVEGDEILAEAALIFNVKLPYGQVALFEAKEGAAEAVGMIMEEVRRLSAKRGVKRVVVGLNGHISYGVGILTEGFEYKNSFDSIYNKPYYRDYFSHLRAEGLSTYKRKKADMERHLVAGSGGVCIRHADLKNFEKETELMRELCDATIGKTFLYYATEKGHFFELMRDLRPFLKNENLFFAEDATGKPLGFLFWHPDFNQMLKGGRNYSTLGLGTAYLLRGKRITTAKLNAVGSLGVNVTRALLNELSRVLGDRFEEVETNFVWDNNLPSTLINERFFGKPHRKYEVYVDEID